MNAPTPVVPGTAGTEHPSVALVSAGTYEETLLRNDVMGVGYP